MAKGEKYTSKDETEVETLTWLSFQGCRCSATSSKIDNSQFKEQYNLTQHWYQIDTMQGKVCS